MGLFGKRKDDVIDYTDSYEYSIRKKPKSHTRTSATTSPASSGTFDVRAMQAISNSQSSSNSNSLGFLSDFAQASRSNSSPSISGTELEYAESTSLEQKERLKQRLLNMTTQLEDLSNQLYRVQQRLELIEQRLKTRNNYLG